MPTPNLTAEAFFQREEDARERRERRLQAIEQGGVFAAKSPMQMRLQEAVRNPGGKKPKTGNKTRDLPLI